MKHLRAAAILAAVVVTAVGLIGGIVMGIFVHPAWWALSFGIAAMLALGAYAEHRVTERLIAAQEKPPAIKPEPPARPGPIDNHFNPVAGALLGHVPVSLSETQRELAAEDARAKRYFDGLGDPQ